MTLAGFLLYFGTNIDNALVLIACLAGHDQGRRRAAIALFCAGLLVLVVSLGLSEALDDFSAWPLNLLAERPDAVRLPVSVGYIAGMFAMMAVVGLLLNRLSGADRLKRWAGRVGPLVMIGFGLFVLADTGGDKL